MSLCGSSLKWLELDAVGAGRLLAEGAPPVVLVLLEVALEPFDVAVALERQDVGRDAVEEPAIVRDHHDAAGESEQGILERAQRVDVEVVGRLVEQQQVAAAGQEQPDSGSIRVGDTVQLAYVDQSRDALDAEKNVWEEISEGAEQPDGGTLKVGETVQIGYVDQSRDSLNPEATVWEEITGGGDDVELGKRKIASRAYVSWFNFKGRDQQRKVGQLSGGERNRVHLAKLLKKGSNLLLLDEPTNDLDVDTLRALEDALLNFAGCVVVISHDRWFLDRIATHILAFEGDSHVEWFEGNFQDYEVDKKRRLGADADQPHRPKFRKLTR